MRIIFPGLRPERFFEPSTVLRHIDAAPPLNPLRATDLDDENASNTRAETALIVGSGLSASGDAKLPSARLQSLLDRQQQQAVILTGSALQMLGEGSLPARQVTAVVLSDPLDHYQTHLPDDPEAIQGIQFLVASHCRPEVFTALQEKAATVSTWNAYIGNGGPDFGARSTSVGMGHGAVTGTMGLMSALGFRTFEVLGWGPVTECPADVTGTSRTDQDVREFVAFSRRHPGAVRSLYIHGHGPAAEILNMPDGTPRTDFAALRPGVPAYSLRRKAPALALHC